MAAIVEARPLQPPRRRDTARTSTAALKRAATQDVETNGEHVAKRRKFTEPYVRDSAYILRKHKGSPVSMIIHLHPTHFRFDGQDGSFSYDSPMKLMIQHLQRQTVPHQYMDMMLSNNVLFYDGCLIVEVHNHIGKDGKKTGASDKEDEKTKFSMHHYTEQLTPSPYVPYPNGAKAASAPELGKDDERSASEKARAKRKDGPTITTFVLYPTELSKHEELKILARTPVTTTLQRKTGSDGTAGAANPPTPMSVPPTPAGGPPSTANGKVEKMVLTDNDLYEFQADMLVATEPPLLLDVADSVEQSHAMIEMLAHPQHSHKAPAPKERKRTTAEMANDDAQAAEAERRMLIMDERIKPSLRTAGTTAGDSSATAGSGAFSRFKTIEAVCQKREETERGKKEDEARAAAEKRHNDEQSQQQQRAQKQRDLQIQQQQQLAKKQQLMAQQQAEHLRQQQIQQHQAQLSAQQSQMMQAHGHPGMQNGMQASPVMRQQSQTPMMNSSPTVAQGGFPMAQTNSQQGINAGSPARPPSAAMQRQAPGVAMARNVSQQGNGSHNNTPQMQSTPSMAQVMPGNRQVSATPRMQPNSPAVGMQQGTPGMGPQMTPNQMMMQNGSMNLQGLTEQQIMLLKMQRQNGMSNVQNPEAIQAANQAASLQSQMRAVHTQFQQAQQIGDAGTANAMQHRMAMLKNSFTQVRQKMVASQQGNPTATPNMQQGTLQMNHGHPQLAPQQPGMPGQMNAQQQAMAQHNAMQQAQAVKQRVFIQGLLKQHNGNIPQHVFDGLAPQMQRSIQVFVQHQQQAQRRAMQQQAQSQMPRDDAGWQMQQARMQMQMQMAQQQQVQQQQQPNFGNMQTPNMGMGMPQQGMSMQQQQVFNQQFAQRDANNLDAQFAAALTSVTGPNGGQQGGQPGGGRSMQ